MSSLIIIALLGGIPLLLGLLLRVHTSALFLSIASGYLLSTFVGDTAGLISRSFITNSSTGMVTKIVVFFLPIIITLWIMRKSLSAAQVVTHFLPLIGCAMLVVVLGIPQFSGEVQRIAYGSFPGNLVKQSADAIVAVAVALQLVLMWITARPRHGHTGRGRSRS